jgi:pimeloyl-ACP methyl ester carboxylesterase
MAITGSRTVVMDGAGVERTEWAGWELVAAGGADGSPTALLLPGAQCTAEFYADVLADPRLLERGARFVAATPPGFGGREPPADPGVATYATLTAELIEHVDCDVVVGHSYFANIAIELAMAGTSTRPLVLLSPAFSRRDEEVGLRWLGLASRLPVVGAVPWAVAGRTLSSLMEGRVPRHDHARLVAEMRRSDRRVNRQLMRDYFQYLGRAELGDAIAARFVASGVRAWVVRGDRDEIGLLDDERAILATSPNVTLVVIPDAGHFVLNDQPGEVVGVVLDALDATVRR